MSHAQRDPGHVLKITRIIHAPRQEVFEAWTNAASVKQWMCPEGSSVSFVELDGGPRQWNGIPFSPSTRRRQPASFR
jgi:uncharacterized protein YndB with AHSA1/START domain